MSNAKGYFVGYGLNYFEYTQIQEKHFRNYCYQKTSYITDNQSNKISLFDISYNANINPKYSYELINILTYYKDFNFCVNGYIPIFITITLDGCYRRMIKGDYSEFNENRLNNEFPKHLRYKYHIKEELSIKECCEILNYQHKKMRDRYFNKYKGIKYDYIKVFEPHKNGVPHLHCIWFIPNDKELIQYLKKIFIECCPAPQNRSKKGLSAEQKKNGEMQGFQLEIKDCVGYVMKYIFKTFKNTKKDKKLSPCHAWYIRHKVRRVCRSHLKTYNNYSFPICAYRKLYSVLKKLNYNDLGDVLFTFWNNENLKISYNLNPKKGKVFIDLELHCIKIFYTKYQIKIIHYADNNFQKPIKTELIPLKHYELKHDKNAYLMTYLLNQDEFLKTA